jgi:hypothetical protein
MRLHISHDSNAVYVADRRVIAWDRIGFCQVLIGIGLSAQKSSLSRFIGKLRLGILSSLYRRISAVNVRRLWRFHRPEIGQILVSIGGTGIGLTLASSIIFSGQWNLFWYLLGAYLAFILVLALGCEIAIN